MKTFKQRGFNDDLDLDTLFTVLLNRINQIILIFLCSVVFFAVIYVFQERIYQSSALLQFESDSLAFIPNRVGDLTENTTSLSAEKEILKSASTLEGVRNKLKSHNDEDLPSLSELSSGMSFIDSGKSLLTINFSNNNSDSTQLILNFILEEFISDRVQNKRLTAIKGIEFIDAEVPKLREQLKLAESELTEFRSSGGNTFIFNNESRGDAIESLNDEIKQIELKEIELREFYKSTHPIYSTLIKQKNILLDELEELENEIQDLPSEQRKLFNLTQRVSIYSSSVEELEKQKLSLGLVAASSTSSIRVINYPSDAVKISPTLSLFLFSFVILIAVYFIYLIDHFFTDKIMSIDSLIDYIEDRNLLIGAFPFIKKDKSNELILKDIEKNFTDRAIINILNSNKKTYLIASMKEGVGKSYFSEKLTNKLSDFSQKICLLDLDLRKKGISESEFFKNKAISYEEYLQTDSLPNLTFIKRPKVEDPLTFLNSPALEELIVKLKNDFDKILIDSPPMGTFIDSKIISNKVDQIICVLSSHESSFSEIPSMTNEVQDQGNTEIIFFLNKVRYFLEIFWFNIRYPLYGNYNYYNPYSYYSDNDSKSFRKVKKYVSFALEKLNYSFNKLKNVVLGFFKK